MDKPFLSFEEQIHKLSKEYGLLINDHDTALEALSSLSYYDLINGYKALYFMNGKDQFIENTSIEQLMGTHIFNKNIQGVLFKYSTYAENSFKTVLSYIIAERFTEHQDEYLNIIHYQKRHEAHQRERLQNILNGIKEICATCVDTPTRHYRETKDHIPPWILFRNISFSNATDLFNFLRKDEKELFFSFQRLLNTASIEYQDKVNIMIDALTFVRKFRNKIAHNLNFMNYRDLRLCKKANSMFVGSLVSNKELSLCRNDVWGMIISIVILLNNKYLIQNFLAELIAFMKFDPLLSEIYCNATGIPKDYEKRITTYLDQLLKGGND